MPRLVHTHRRLIAALLCATLGSCAGSDSTGANDVPVSIEFVSLVGPQHRHKARVRYVNHTDRDIRSVRSVLVFVDERGEPIVESPWAETDTILVAAKDRAERDVGTYVPEGTVDVRAEVSLVVFSDDAMWNRNKSSRKE